VVSLHILIGVGMTVEALASSISVRYIGRSSRGGCRGVTRSALSNERTIDRGGGTLREAHDSEEVTVLAKYVSR
jgi:hypothetical protein